MRPDLVLLYDDGPSEEGEQMRLPGLLAEASLGPARGRYSRSRRTYRVGGVDNEISVGVLPNAVPSRMWDRLGRTRATDDEPTGDPSSWTCYDNFCRCMDGTETLCLEEDASDVRCETVSTCSECDVCSPLVSVTGGKAEYSLSKNAA